VALRKIAVKKVMNKKLENSIVIIIAIIVIPFICYAGFKIFRLRDPTFQARSFDHQLWIKSSIRDRGEMVQNLQDSNILSNLTKKQVCELLGPPDVNYPNRKFYYTVDVGRLIAGSMFPEQLYFIFDANERVVEYGRVD
jgi:hypothetical protein